MEGDCLLEQLSALGILLNDFLFVHAVMKEVRTDERQAHVLQHTVEIGTAPGAISVQPPKSEQKMLLDLRSWCDR